MFTEIGIVLFLLLLNGFFAMSELAVVSARRVRLKQMADGGSYGAQKALILMDDQTTFLSMVQVGMTLSSVLAGAFSGATFAGRIGEYFDQFSVLAPYGHAIALAVTVVGVTYLNLVIGELLPKRIGLNYAETIAVRIAPVVCLFVRIFTPVVWLLKFSTELLLKGLRLDHPQDALVTEDEVKNMIAEGAESGALKPTEKAMLDSVMRLADRTVRSIMTPRMDMVWLDCDDPMAESMQAIRDSGYSRFPVARGDLTDVIGIAYTKDLLKHSLEDVSFSLSSVMRAVLKVPETTPVLRLLDQFKQSHQHIAIIIDEYGSVEGLVSLTDILEAITGVIPEGMQEGDSKPVRREDGSWLIDGMMPIDEVETLIDLKGMRDGQDFHTLAGFMIDCLGRMPTAGDQFCWGGACFEVVDMDGRRVDKVLVQPHVREESEEHSES